MKVLIKSLLAVTCSAVFGTSAFAQQTSLPSNNYPQVSTPVTPSTLVYPGMKNISTATRVNYIRTQIPDVPLQSIPATGNDYIRQNTSYFDGLGRPLQEVAKKAHALGLDLVQPHVYDAAGRETYQYLPYALPVELSTGKMNKPVNSRMHQFYDNLGPDENPYSKTETDNSPLNTLKKQLAPGRSWVGSNRGVEYGYRSNVAGEVRIWTIGNSANALAVSVSSYNAGEIRITKVTDEDGKFSLEYKDKTGKLILKKSLVLNNSQPESDHNGYACTYYVYDDLNRLRCVIPPEAVVQKTIAGNTWSISQAGVDGLCFNYFYDERGQVIEKRIPGKKVEYLVYDKRGRLCLSQDGNLRQQHKWKFTAYDALDRAICTGLYENATASRQDLQGYFYNNTSYTYPSLFYYLTNYKNYKEYPLNSTPNATILTNTYYDDYEEYGPLFTYSFDGSQFDNIGPLPSTVVSSERSNHTRGLLTGTKTRVLDPDSPNVIKWLVSVNYYDNKGRLIQTQSQNIKGGLDISSNIYYFQGMLWKNIMRHDDPLAEPVPGVTDGALNQIYVVKTFERNLAIGGGNEQVKKVTQKIGNGIVYDLAYYQYDHLGRTTYKGFTAGEVLQEYNMRGFLNHINVKNENNDPNSRHIFQEKLYYDTGFASKLYNGNIAGITWKKAGAQAPVEAYGYSYDLLNRLTHAEYRRNAYDYSTGWLNSSYNYTASGITYDMNGNIGSMTQKNPNGLSGMNMDALTYQYAPNSNKLIKVTDAIVASNTPGLPDFKDNANDAEEYHYDSCGNVIIDENKSISSITYNYLNKPEKITTSQGVITYVYDALGNKLQKRVHSTGPNPPADEAYDYIGNFIYKQNILQYILNDEGRTRPIPIEDGANSGNFTTKFVYDYFIKDHLGNVRSTVTSKPLDGVYLARHEISSANIEQLLFDNIPNVRANKPGSTAINDGFAARLDGSIPSQRVGTAIMLQTMPGDRFTISADAYYEGEYQQQDEGPTEDLVSSLMSALTGGGTYAGIPVSELPDNVRTITTALNSPGLLGGLDNLLNSNYNPNAPKAHLNFLFFNDKLELVPGNSGSIQVPVNPMGWTTINPSMVVGSATAIQNGQVYSNGPGYVIIFIDNQSLGKQVWFDNVMVGHYRGEVAEENHYYPFGLTLETSPMVTGVTNNPLKYQAVELEKHFGLETYETFFRGLDPQLGRFNSIDPKAENHFDINPYVSMGNNPVLNVDPRGDDWFVNNVDGGVVYMKNVTEPNQMAFYNAGFNGPVDQYDRLGANNMFGNSVKGTNGENMLNDDLLVLGNSEAFMQGRGYNKAEKVDIEEKEYTSGGPMGAGERIKQVTATLEQIGDSKITYVKPPNLNKKVVEKEERTQGRWSSMRSITYNLTKPFGQSNSKTAEFGGNKEILGVKAGDATTGATVAGKIFSVIKSIFKK
jgi:RHS repeat-associated protein